MIRDMYQGCGSTGILIRVLVDNATGSHREGMAQIGRTIFLAPGAVLTLRPVWGQLRWIRGHGRRQAHRKMHRYKERGQAPN